MLAQNLGWLATFLFTIMLVPQIIKTYLTKTTKGVSIISYLVCLLANVIALWYAFLINQPPLIFKYILAIVVLVFYIILFYRIKMEEECY